MRLAQSFPTRTPCPKCGPVEGLSAHLRVEHGFTRRRAIATASKITQQARLSQGEYAKLGLVRPPVKLRGQAARVVVEAVPGLPSDRELDAVVREAFGA